MKKIIYGALAMTLTFGTISCSDFLDLAPINKITENDIFGSEAGIEAYMATLYNRLPIEDFNYGSESGFNNWVSMKYSDRRRKMVHGISGGHTTMCVT